MVIPEEHKKYLRLDFHVSQEIESRLSKEDLFNIEIYGQWLSALEQGKLSPITEEQIEFLEVCKGTIPPKTEIQKSWLNYKKLRNIKFPCKLCIGKGHYTPPGSGVLQTCERCGGTGYQGLSSVKITVEGSY